MHELTTSKENEGIDVSLILINNWYTKNKATSTTND